MRHPRALAALAAVVVLAGCDTYQTRHRPQPVVTNLPAGTPVQADFAIDTGLIGGGVPANGVCSGADTAASPNCTWLADTGPDGTLRIFAGESFWLGAKDQLDAEPAPSHLMVRADGYRIARSSCTGVETGRVNGPLQGLSRRVTVHRSVTCGPLVFEPLPSIRSALGAGDPSIEPGTTRLDVRTRAGHPVETMIVLRSRHYSDPVRAGIGCPMNGRSGGVGMAGTEIEEDAATTLQRFTIDTQQFQASESEPYAEVYVRAIDDAVWGDTGLRAVASTWFASATVELEAGLATPIEPGGWFHALSVPIHPYFGMPPPPARFVAGLQVPPCAADAITVTGVRSVPDRAMWRTGDVRDLLVDFSAPVLTSSSTELRLETGYVDVRANNTSPGFRPPRDSPPGPSIVVKIRVASEMNTPRLDYLSRDALSSDVRGADGRPVNLTLPEPGTAGSLGFNSLITVNR